MTEAELIAGCVKENKACQEELYYRFSGRMYALCLRYAGNRQEAEDMMIEGFLKVFDNINKFRMEGSFDGWIRKIIVNTALYHLKLKKNLFVNLNNENHENIFSNDEDDDTNALNRISAAEITQMISEIPAGYRTVFNLFVVDGYSHKEIGELLNITESTSRSQLTKARKLLKNKIKVSTEIYHHGS